MPSAIDDAISLYGPEFARIHGLYLKHGYCYSEPSMFGMARPVDSKNPNRWLGQDELNLADAWWIELAVGKNAMPVLYMHLPFGLPYLGWARAFKGRPEPRFVRTEKVTARILK